ncbi:hypothetical protein PoB_004812700 [Plakobranchus ocellatus]|uniref:Uncharacterized protein n=1 Tax=Plakobranchus ocellatus TaxID=259542 RepID=A0AAV4BQH9_9GAST|nr:hypothetical protein PoB_004812700 [Plakobranchus ocellatus]
MVGSLEARQQTGDLRFSGIHQARASVAGLEPAIEESLQISERVLARDAEPGLCDPAREQRQQQQHQQQQQQQQQQQTSTANWSNKKHASLRPDLVSLRCSEAKNRDEVLHADLAQWPAEARHSNPDRTTWPWWPDPDYQTSTPTRPGQASSRRPSSQSPEEEGEEEKEKEREEEEEEEEDKDEEKDEEEEEEMDEEEEDEE